MTVFLNWVSMLVAGVLTFQMARALASGMKAAALPFVCSIAYLFLGMDWIFTDQITNIGEMRDFAWSLVEIGFMLGYIGRELERERVCIMVRRFLEKE